MNPVFNGVPNTVGGLHEHLRETGRTDAFPLLSGATLVFFGVRQVLEMPTGRALVFAIKLGESPLPWDLRMLHISAPGPPSKPTEALLALHAF